MGIPPVAVSRERLTSLRLRPRARADGCIQWFKDTNLEANHNSAFPVKFFLSAVFNGSKIPICNIGIYTEQNLIVPYKYHNMLFYSSNYSIHTFFCIICSLSKSIYAISSPMVPVYVRTATIYRTEPVRYKEQYL